MGRKPTLNYLHVWGCLAEAKNFNTQINKLDSKTISSNFIGYPKKSKGFRFCFHGQGFKIVETRHAVFLENEYFSGRTELKKLISNEVSTPKRFLVMKMRMSQLQKYLYVDQLEKTCYIKWLQSLS